MMRMLVIATVAALVLSSGDASAQVSFSAGVRADVVVEPPAIEFDVRPPLVVVSPGIYVVEDYDYEVFYVSGWYWSNRSGVWFRTRDYHGGWRRAPARYVPGKLVRMPHGRYKHFHGRGNRVVNRGGHRGGGGHFVGHGRSGGGGRAVVRDHRGGGGGHRGGGGRHGR